MAAADAPRLPSDVRRVLDDAELVRRRLVRLARSLAASSDEVARQLERLALAKEAGGEALTAVAKQLRDSANACFEFEQRLQRGTPAPGDGYGTVPAGA